ncbi:MAG: AI-2E family transporter [Synergistales bacterium]|nr:AI-2E family transporter [Synergistales bacterium]
MDDSSLTQRYDRVAVIFLGLLTLFALGVVLKYARPVILPLVIAWLLSYILGPVVTLMARRGIPWVLSVIMVLPILLGIGFLFATLVQSQLTSFAVEYPKYQARFAEISSALVSQFDTPGNVTLDVFNVNWGQRIGSYIVQISGSFVALVTNLVKVIFFLFFLLLGKPYFKYKLIKAFSDDHARYLNRILESISFQVGRYLAVLLFVSFLTGFLTWLFLSYIGLDFALTWGVVTFLLNFIPTVGSIIATIPPILLSLVQFYPDFWMTVICMAALITIQMSIGNILLPNLLGQRLNLSPVVVLLALLFWGWLWGIAGALLSVPLASAIKIVCENIRPLHFVSVIMGSGKSYKKELLGKRVKEGG